MQERMKSLKLFLQILHSSGQDEVIVVHSVDDILHLLITGIFSDCSLKRHYRQSWRQVQFDVQK